MKGSARLQPAEFESSPLDPIPEPVVDGSAAKDAVNKVHPRSTSYGGRLSLSDWLEVSWFYPDGFRKERIIETKSALLVIGESVVYKFIKAGLLQLGQELSSAAQIALEHSGIEPGEAAPLSINTLIHFPTQWRAVCREVNANRELAPDLYLGVRLLRWIEDEPHWMTELRGSVLEPENPPAGADLAALVLRRVPEQHLLGALLEEGEELTHEQVKMLGQTLTQFHSRKRRAGVQAFRARPEALLAAAKGQGNLRFITDFARQYGTFLDPFSTTALRESLGYLLRFQREHEDLFHRRAREGFVVQGHGELHAEHICLEPLLPDARQISIFGRNLRAANEAGDVLWDLASLAVDLRVLEAPHIASEMERQYFSKISGLFNAPLYRYHLTAASLRRAASLIMDGPIQRGHQANTFLSLALRYSLNLRGPFVLGIGGYREEGSEDLARSLAELLSARLVTPEQVTPRLAGYVEPELIVFDRLLTAAARAVRNEEPVIILWEFSQSEERFTLAQLAKSLSVPHLLVKCTEGKAGKIKRRAQSPQSFPADFEPARFSRGKPWPEPRFGNTRQMLVECSLPQTELSLYVAKELSRAPAHLPRP